MKRAALLLPILLLVACAVDRRGEILHCSAHDVPLHEDSVEIVYGLTWFDEERHAAARRDFPYEGRPVLGGCVVHPCNPGWARIRFCPACRKAGRAWRR